GTDSQALTETNSALSTGGKLDATDVDSSAAFVVQTNVAGDHGYGKFSIAADGTWTYAASNAHDEFKDGIDYTDSLVVKTADGTEHTISVTITGTNDAAEITGTDSQALTETNSALSTGGKLDATDVDSSSDFVAQTDAAGDKGYGKFSIAADGTWTYAANSPHDEFVDGQKYTDSLVVKTADGTEHTISVTITGTNDAAEITGTDSKALTETNAALSTGGKLDATDVDSSSDFVAQTDAAGDKGYGKFSIATDGTWTYAANNAHDEFKDGVDYTDSLVVKTADGTEHTISVTISGTNDAPTGSATTVLTAGTEDTDYTVTKAQLLAGFSDAEDGTALSVTGFGVTNATFTANADGSYTIHPNADFNGDVAISYNVADSLNASTAGSLTLAIAAVNDAPVIDNNGGGATANVSVAENSTAVTTVHATDIDSPSIAYSIVGGADQGKFTINATTGALAFASAPNFEVPTDVGGNNIYDVIVRASDGSASDDQAIAVTVTDVAEGLAPTDIAFHLATGGASVAQQGNLGATQEVGTFAAVDPDSLTWSYSLGGADASKFTIDANGLLKVGATTISTGGGVQSFTVEITATDDQSNTKTETYYINVGTNGDNDGSAANKVLVAVHAASDISFGLNGSDVIGGGDGDDALAGGAADDKLNGGLGNDELLGGAGNDHFVFTSFGAANADKILDFDASETSASQDWLDLSHATFTALPAGTSLAAANFAANATGTAVDANDYILFNTTTNQLYYDADGNGGGAKQLIATLTGMTGTLDASDFLLIA
ncbi:VCBS domain-containing protein, partial [Novosphingobium sp. KCTC 2891]|uniref:VCBS domain-containing protein n=1 Tax=Novosphingobium sp. KCTC 2891 TaxID=2989730 RepID=UPI00222296DA